MRLLVCGGRDFRNWNKLCDTLDGVRIHRGFISHVIHGGARGADELAGDWARMRAIQEVICPANWNLQGKSAGHIRNQAMLGLLPDLVVAFPGGRGTESMKRLARGSEVEVLEVVV